MTDATLCPDADLQHLLGTLQGSDDAGMTELDRLLGHHPDDPRLHFLRGSVLAGLQRYDEGREAMRHAVTLAPGYELARFQLGFLEMTSGLVAEARATWAAFATAPVDAPFRLLSEGLLCLAADDFGNADQLIRRGMARNVEHPLINNDMQLLLDEVASKIPEAASGPAEAPEPASAAHQLLQQFELKDSVGKTRH